jgi:predicted lipoprotein with Yx(FWY)xxD motif
MEALSFGSDESHLPYFKARKPEAASGTDTGGAPLCDVRHRWRRTPGEVELRTRPPSITGICRCAGSDDPDKSDAILIHDESNAADSGNQALFAEGGRWLSPIVRAACPNTKETKMIKTRLALAAIPAGLAALVALAGCGGGSSASSAAGPSTSGATGGGMATIDMSKNPQLGPILTDSNGDTVYVFAKDSKGMSNCEGSCASLWPPVTTSGKPTAGDGVVASKLGTTKRSDGSTQVTYAGRPLYTYTSDASPGDVTGNGINTFGAVWNAVQPNGSNAPAGSSGGASSTGRSTTSGGYGY